MKRKSDELMVTPGGVLQRLTREQVASCVALWPAAFPANRSGIHLEQFMWHVFSFNRYPNISKADAKFEYE